MKIKKSINISKELLVWVDKKIEEKEFSSLSHAVEKGLYQLKKTYEHSEK